MGAGLPYFICYQMYFVQIESFAEKGIIRNEKRQCHLFVQYILYKIY